MISEGLRKIGSTSFTIHVLGHCTKEDVGKRNIEKDHSKVLNF